MLLFLLMLMSSLIPTENAFQERVGSIVTILLKYGRGVGPFMPWHTSTNPYHWIIAEILLKLTTRVAAREAYLNMIDTYPTWDDLRYAEEEELAKRITCAGLQKQRARTFKALSEAILSKFGDIVPCSREALLKLPGVGSYVADAILLYVYKQKVIPLDGNIQRILRRTLGEPMPKSTRRANPYGDTMVNRAAALITGGASWREINEIHRALLDIGWRYCRYHPKGASCPIQNHCSFYIEHGV